MDESTHSETTRTRNGLEVRYTETETERVLVFEHPGAGTDGLEAGGDTVEPRRRAVIAQNRAGYGMLKVRSSIDGDELERYYGFDMALDHAAELLGVEASTLMVPEDAADMGM